MSQLLVVFRRNDLKVPRCWSGRFYSSEYDVCVKGISLIISEYLSTGNNGCQSSSRSADRENAIFSAPFAPETFISGLNLVLTNGVSSAFRGGVHLFTNRHRLGHEFHQVTQWRSTSLPRVRPYVASNPVTGAVILQVTMDQFNCALFSHTLPSYYYWYEVGMLRVLEAVYILIIVLSRLKIPDLFSITINPELILGCKLLVQTINGGS